MKYKFTLDKRREKNDGSFPVVLQIFNEDKIRISTNLYAFLGEWDDNSFFCKKSENYARKNAILNKIKYDMDKLAFSLEDSKEYMSDKKLRETICENIFQKRKKKSERIFIDYLDEFVAKKKNNGTKSVYIDTRNKILKFDDQCSFKSMDKKWLERFEQWMIDRGMKTNAYAIHLRNIRAIFNYAIDEEYTTLYPFRKFKIKKEETRKRSLTVEQLRMLRDYPCDDYQKKYRDMFLLMFYLLGINAADLFLAKKTDVVNGRLEYKRAKTGKLYSVKIEPEAQDLLEKYKGKGEYLVNVMDSYKNYKDYLHRMGDGLKNIGEMERKGLGGKKIIKPLFPDLSSYWSRHTWATLAAEIDIPIETISAALGHSYGSSTTNIYIRFDLKKVDDANRKVIDYVMGRLEI